MTSVDFSRRAKTDPTEILRQRDGLYGVELMGAAISGLNFFSWLEANPSFKEQICQSLKIHERPTDVMLTFFTAMGLIEKRLSPNSLSPLGGEGQGEGAVFHLTQLAREFLSDRSQWNLIAYYQAMDQRPVCKDMLTVLRTGKPATWASYKDQKEWAKAMEDERFARMFTAAMDCRGVYIGQALADRVNLKTHKRLLDIAGGSGVYACALVAANSHLSATILEKPPVDKIAREMIQSRGFHPLSPAGREGQSEGAARVQVHVSDMFTDSFPPNHDIHLFSNVLHDWDVPIVKQLIAKSVASLPPGGLIVIHDAYINADKSGPLPVAAYSVLLMGMTEGKCYSTAEMQSYLQEAGFTNFTFAPTAADRGVMTGRKPR